VDPQQLLVTFERSLTDSLLFASGCAGLDPLIDPLTDGHLGGVDVLAGIARSD
jgi:hypothetical protein